MPRTNRAAAFLAIAIVSHAFSAPTLASPGPLPPEYIMKASKRLVPTQTAATFEGYAGEMASDLSVWIDGEKIASSKASWLAIERRRIGKVDRHVLGYVDGYDSILVVDLFDDRSDLPENPNLLFDPRFKTRAVQYRFGLDRKVHTIRITQTEGVLQKPS